MARAPLEIIVTTLRAFAIAAAGTKLALTGIDEPMKSTLMAAPNAAG